MTLYLFGLLACAVSAFGWESRGAWKQYIEIIGGLLWLAGVIWAFVDLGWKGILFVFGTFFVARILIPIMRSIVHAISGH